MRIVAVILGLTSCAHTVALHHGELLDGALSAAEASTSQCWSALEGNLFCMPKAPTDTTDYHAPTAEEGLALCKQECSGRGAAGLYYGYCGASDGYRSGQGCYYVEPIGEAKPQHCGCCFAPVLVMQVESTPNAAPDDNFTVYQAC